MKRLLVATMNPGKVREFAAALRASGIEIYGLDFLGDAAAEIEETGETFEENAKLKAEGYSRQTELTVLADDSGLEVDVLDGEPGVYSARYGGEGLDDEERNRKLLKELRGVPEAERTARFRCVLAVACDGQTLATFEGVVEGRIVDQPRGSNGFGYDPLFFYPEAGCTTAELSTEEKQRISHRGKAIAAFLAALEAGDSRLAPAG